MVPLAKSPRMNSSVPHCPRISATVCAIQQKLLTRLPMILAFLLCTWKQKLSSLRNTAFCRYKRQAKYNPRSNPAIRTTPAVGKSRPALKISILDENHTSPQTFLSLRRFFEKSPRHFTRCGLSPVGSGAKRQWRLSCTTFSGYSSTLGLIYVDALHKLMQDGRCLCSQLHEFPCNIQF